MRAVLSLIALAVATGGCGYKTPLSLPAPNPEAQQPAPAPPAKSDDKKSGGQAVKD